jgi:hypothetical protein
MKLKGLPREEAEDMLKQIKSDNEVYSTTDLKDSINPQEEQKEETQDGN